MSEFKFDDSGWQEFKRRLEGIRGTYVKVGVLASKGGNEDHDGISMLELAAIHEMGSPAANIPERSFIRRTFQNKILEYEAMVARLTQQFAAGRASSHTVLNMLGLWGVAQVKSTITNTYIPPPLEDATIAARKRRSGKASDRPLVDTGRLLGAIQHEVIGGER